MALEAEEATETAPEAVPSSLGKRKADVSEESDEKEKSPAIEEIYGVPLVAKYKEVVWDVDSFDEYEYESPEENFTSDEENDKLIRRYQRQVIGSKGKNLILDHVVRANANIGCRLKAYITFMAKESDKDDTLVMYQAKAVDILGGPNIPVLCRPCDDATMA